MRDNCLDRSFALGQHKGLGIVKQVPLGLDDVAPSKVSMLARYVKDWDSRSPRLNYALLRREVDAAVGTNFDAFRTKFLARFRDKALRETVRKWLFWQVAEQGSVDERYATWVVDPDSRTLARCERTLKPARPKPAPTRIELGPDAYLLKQDGVWYEIRTAPVPAHWAQGYMPLAYIPTDVVSHESAVFCGKAYNASKRQLSKKELLALGLMND